MDFNNELDELLKQGYIDLAEEHEMLAEEFGGNDFNPEDLEYKSS